MMHGLANFKLRFDVSVLPTCLPEYTSMNIQAY